MFARFLCILVATHSVVATPRYRRHHSSASACSTGPIQCCESTAAMDSPSSSVLLAFLGMTLQDTTGLIGFNCNPITAGGVNDPTCQQSAVCCENNNVGGLISLGCAPVSL